MGSDIPRSAADATTTSERPRAAGWLPSGRFGIPVTVQRGALAPGLLADFAAYGADLFTAQLDTVTELLPELTVISGKAVHDQEDCWPEPRSDCAH